MPKKYDIISIGSAVRDIFIKSKDLRCQGKICHPFEPKNIGNKITVKEMYFDIGGGGSNSAATFSNMGLKTALLSQIANDLPGKEIIRTMEKFKVDTSLINVKKNEETGYSVIFISGAGDRTALIFRGASDFKKFKLKKTRLDARWFFITSLNGNIQLLEQLFKAAGKNNIKIAWNPGNAELYYGHVKLKKLLQNTNFLLLNLKEAKLLAKSKSNNIKTLFDKLNKFAPKATICITAGKKGAWVKNQSQILFAKILDKKVINATGAGDAFGSGFISGIILYNNDISKSLQLAMLNSNSVVAKMGAKHGLLPKPPNQKNLGKIKIKTQ
ncbi:MAG: carbohydrate kinase family protein [Patescibacteria group bacterium]